MKPLTTKQQQAQFRAANRAYAIMGGKPIRAEDQEPIPRKLSVKKSTVQLPKRTERDVQRDILKWLNIDKRVVLVRRINSGALPNAQGRYVKFNRVRGKNHEDIRMADIECTLANGGTMAIECKEPGWTEPHWNRLQDKDWLSEKEARELGQWRYLNTIRALPRGIGIFANDVQQVIDKLNSI